MDNVLRIKDRMEFRKWLRANSETEKECFVINLKRGNPDKSRSFCYIDAVEEALCFGWIDSLYKNIDGTTYQRFSPRSKRTLWTALNVARVKRLQRLGLMTEKGLSCLPSEEPVLDQRVLDDIKSFGGEADFDSLPELYKAVKVSNLSSLRSRSEEAYKDAVCRFVKSMSKGKLTPGWDDYGRLSE